MSFGFQCHKTGLVYAGNDLNGFFAQRIQPVQTTISIVFSLKSGASASQANLLILTQAKTWEPWNNGSFRHRFMPFMVENYLKPMAAAIWSTPSRPGRRLSRPVLSPLFPKSRPAHPSVNRPSWRTVSRRQLELC